MAYMRYPGVVLGVEEDPAPQVLTFLADQIGISPEAWENYDRGAATSRRHALELQRVFGFTSFTALEHRLVVEALSASALVTDHGFMLAEELVESFRRRKVLLPPLAVMEKMCAEAITRGNRAV